MVVVTDTNGKRLRYATNALCKNSLIPGMTKKDDENFVIVNDDSAEAKTIKTSYECVITSDSKVNVLKTKEQHIKDSKDQEQLKQNNVVEEYNKIDKKDSEAKLKFIEKFLGLVKE